ncbi:MAG TPA: MogA/MoaB family molybdenum cofactor biosynthesis protein [Bryobacteraceae bacterium]|nr:MogA/MoaB family molybdenum cofactor biosynthesis protein [Bryobacteraceae bacterium]
MIRAAVVTVSDSAHLGTRDDKSGPAVAERLSRSGFQVARSCVTPDERPLIARAIREIADAGAASAIFTTGGTGVAPRDVTPEATRDVIDREIPGMSEAMRMKGLASTPYAMLSRAVVGIRGKTLIVNLPGSPRGALQSLDAILELVPHVLDLIEGRTSHSASEIAEAGIE